MLIFDLKMFIPFLNLDLVSYLIFVTGTTGGTRGKQICHVEKFVHMTDCYVDKFLT